MKKDYLGEVWRPIRGYEGLYEVSNFGQVRSIERTVSNKIGSWKINSKIKTQRKDNRGYYRVKLCKGGKIKSFAVHRLVAEAFIPNPYHYSEVNHKNCIKTDNRADNLEWCTRSYNVNYGNGNRKRRLSNLNREDESKVVLQFTLDGKCVAKYPSIAEAARITGVNRRQIGAVCNHQKRINPNGRETERKTAGGFIWRFAS